MAHTFAHALVEAEDARSVLLDRKKALQRIVGGGNFGTPGDIYNRLLIPAERLGVNVSGAPIQDLAKLTGTGTPADPDRPRREAIGRLRDPTLAAVRAELERVGEAFSVVDADLGAAFDILGITGAPGQSRSRVVTPVIEAISRGEIQPTIPEIKRVQRERGIIPADPVPDQARTDSIDQDDRAPPRPVTISQPTQGPQTEAELRAQLGQLGASPARVAGMPNPAPPSLGSDAGSLLLLGLGAVVLIALIGRGA